MFRAALLSTVLTLAAGQNAAALLCGVWCHSGGGMTGACEHQTEAAPPDIIANDGCTVTSNATVYVREDVRRSVSAPTVLSGVPVPRFVFTPPASSSLSGYEAARRAELDFRPLVLALRI
ncbi:MAG TPA: hypothetical protein VFO67_04100 [Gemmatimonadales bacterium]|nr:hypothetical protein [Gemmatimonadales bacterium]